LTQKIPACIEGRTTHQISNGICIHCGWIPQGKFQESKASEKIETEVKVTKESTAKRPVGRPKSEPTISRKDAQDGITMILLAAQTIVLTARPDLKEDALNPQERALLADALTDEAFQSTQIKKFLVQVGKQQKHAKLFMVLTALAIPRLARRGLFPQETMQEMNDELIAQANSRTGFSGDSPTGSEIDWESVPVASGGSPFTNRRNGIGENNVSGVVAETAPLRSSVTDEIGRREIRNGSDHEVPSNDEKSPSKPDRVKTGSTTDRSEKS